MIDGLKLSLLRRNPGVSVRRLEEGPYLITFSDKAWLLWTTSSRWIEVDPGNLNDRLGDMHYGPVAVFYEKHIRRKRGLPRNHGKLWVEDDVELLYALIDEDVSIEKIAEEMGRSVSSIIAKTGSLLGYDFSYINTSRGVDGLTFSKLVSESQLSSFDDDNGSRD